MLPDSLSPNSFPAYVSWVSALLLATGNARCNMEVAVGTVFWLQGRLGLQGPCGFHHPVHLQTWPCKNHYGQSPETDG